MMHTMPRSILTWLASFTFLCGVGLSKEASAAEVVKIGTLFPRSSPWGQVLSVWEEAVKQKSGGRLELQFSYNAQQGDEGAMIGKIKAGQLQAAVVTGVGLSKIYKPILALQLPGLFPSWGKLDAARAAMKGEFEKGAADAGFRITGWTDAGVVRLMSKGFPVRLPTDITGKKPFQWRDDATQPALYQAIGGVNPVSLNIPEVLPQLNTGAVNIVMASSLLMEQLQWASKLDHLVTADMGYAIGAFVFSSKALDGLPADLRQIIVDTGNVAANALTARIRNEDAASFGRIKAKATVIDLTSDEKTKWDGIFKQMRQKLVPATFSAALITRLEGLGK